MLESRGRWWLAQAGDAAVAPRVIGEPARIDSATPFLLWRTRRSGTAPEQSPSPPAGVRGDAALWWRLASPAANAHQDWTEWQDGAGPVFPWSGASTIEVWTESELAAMQALWWLAREHGRPGLRDRALDAALWHIEHTQPDNATNRPWAVGVFLDLWLRDGSLESRLFAETLLHNTEAGASGQRRLIGELLLDASDAAGLLAGAA